MTDTLYSFSSQFTYNVTQCNLKLSTQYLTDLLNSTLTYTCGGVSVLFSLYKTIVASLSINSKANKKNACFLYQLQRPSVNFYVTLDCTTITDELCCISLFFSLKITWVRSHKELISNGSFVQRDTLMGKSSVILSVNHKFQDRFIHLYILLCWPTSKNIFPSRRNQLSIYD